MICADCYIFSPQDEGTPHRFALHALGPLRKLQRAESFGVVHVSWASKRQRATVGGLDKEKRRTENLVICLR
jgi:hypothetical protein